MPIYGKTIQRRLLLNHWIVLADIFSGKIRGTSLFKVVGTFSIGLKTYL